MLVLHQGFEPGDHIGVFRSDVAGFRGIYLEVVEFSPDLSIGELLPNGFPITNAHRLLPAVGWEFAIKKRTGLLLLAKQRGGKADSINALTTMLGSAHFHQRRQPIFKTGDTVRCGSRRDAALPAHRQRHAYAA